MDDFREYLVNSRVANAKTAPFYIQWVTQFFNYCHKHPLEDCTLTIQELLGHRHLETTMVYTHVAQTNRLGIVSPLDKTHKNN